MTNQELLQKMKEDMEMRGFSHWTKESYELKAKDVMRYFKKPMEKVGVRIDIWTHLMRGCIIELCTPN